MSLRQPSFSSTDRSRNAPIDRRDVDALPLLVVVYKHR
ncbi:MAG: hypothetical protein QOJ20_407 [Mycobacterium sp.]|jgi:hypothetical protein|nr:hypothetical protein [Mycobacterium sp.]